MRGKTCVVTGANTGIGLETARGLAARGATVVMTARDADRGEAALADVRRTVDGAKAELLLLDLASTEAIRAAAQELRQRHQRIHVLINNAGAITGERRTTRDGFEATFGINHLGPFLWTSLLLDLLEAGAPARIVNVASRAHTGSKGIDFDDPMRERRPYRAFGAYADSKLANLLFTRELAQRIGERRIHAHAVHPGVVGTRFGRDGDAGWLFHWAMLLGRPFLLSPEKGARTSLHVATCEEAGRTNGRYWVSCRIARPARRAQDDEAARKLWQLSERLVGLG